MLGSNGLYNYNNPAYINIVRSGYKAVSGKEWYNDAKIHLIKQLDMMSMIYVMHLIQIVK